MMKASKLIKVFWWMEYKRGVIWGGGGGGGGRGEGGGEGVEVGRVGEIVGGGGGEGERGGGGGGS